MFGGGRLADFPENAKRFLTAKYVLFIVVIVCLACRMTNVRIACLQWEFHSLTDESSFWREFEWQLRMAREDYAVDLVILPEYAAAGFPGGWPEQGVWKDFLLRVAAEQRFWIVGGTMPFPSDRGLLNRCGIAGPQGQWHHQDKLHITPWEKNTWNMIGGDKWQVIDIGLCKIAVAICYDVEFPEQIRAYAEAGAELLCVPYCTDDVNGHHRVTRCALARAVENTMYVATAGCVGTLRDREGFEHHHAQSLIATPCDIGFPMAGIAARAERGRAQCLVAEIDLTRLREARTHGTVLPMKDVRRDLFR